MKSSEDSSAAKERPYIGGQAVIEGVMMRSPRSFAIVVRRRSGALVVRERRMKDARKGIWAWPMVRGVVTLVESLRLGSQALRFSSEHFEADLEAEEQEKEKVSKTQSSSKQPPASLTLLTSWLVGLLSSDLEPGPRPEPPSRETKTTSSLTWVAMVLALLVFVALPQGVAAGTSRLFHWDLDIRSPGFQLMTGVFKLTIVLGYMLVIRRVPEIYRVFQFHGAEHKAIAAYESGEGLSVENARSKSRLHPRCGTTFLVMVVFISILVFTALGPFLPHLGLGGLADNVLFFVMKLPFLPLIASITYEIQRISARYCVRGPLRAVLYPGFAVQLITTIEPDDTQLEVALASLRATLWREQAAPSMGDEARPDRTFDSFSHLMADAGYQAPAVTN